MVTKNLVLELQTNQVADFFGVTPRQVNNWQRAGCPKLKYGVFDLKAVFIWWVDNIAASKVEESDEDLKDVKLEYWRWRGAGEKIRVEKETENLIPRESISAAWSWRMSEVTSGLQALAMRLAPLVEGKDQVEIQRIIASEVWKLRDNYCRNGKFCPNGGGL